MMRFMQQVGKAGTGNFASERALKEAQLPFLNSQPSIPTVQDGFLVCESGRPRERRSFLSVWKCVYPPKSEGPRRNYFIF